MGAAPVNEDSSQRGKCMTRCSTPTPGIGLHVLAVLLVVSGCATVRGVAALREVDFQPDRVQGVRLAGIPLDGVRSPEDVSPDLLALVAAGALAGTVPLECQVIVRATNPASNPVTAQILRMDWMLLLSGRDAVGGRVDHRYAIAPGQTVEVPVHLAVDLADVVGRHADTLIRLGVALAQGRDGPVDLRLRLSPIVDTPLGGMRIPSFTIPLETASR
jgi:hypothetical protein